MTIVPNRCSLSRIGKNVRLSCSAIDYYGEMAAGKCNIYTTSFLIAINAPHFSYIDFMTPSHENHLRFSASKDAVHIHVLI